MKYAFLALVLFLACFAVPGFLPSEESRRLALEAGFTTEQIERGEQYSLERKLLFWSTTILQMGLLLFLTARSRPLATGCAKLVRGWWLPTVLLVGLVCTLVEEAVNLPYGLAHLELMRAWGLTQRGWGDWLQEHFLAKAVFGGLEALVLAGFYLLLRYCPRTWWLWSALGATLVAGLGAYLLPIVFAPLFNTFTPLSRTEWANLEPGVQALLEKAEVSVGDVLVMDGSRQSGHTNAYFTGFGSTRRIVMYDTLLKKHTAPEVESVLAHELGHWLHHHIVKGICLGALASLLGFFLLYRFLRWVKGRPPWLLKDAVDPAGLPLILLCAALASWVAMPLENAVSRHFERQADAMSLELAGQPEVFIASERKLALDNISNLAPHPLAVFLFSTHPPAVERIQMAREWERK